MPVTAWLAGVDAVALYVSAITLMEIELGVLQLERRGLGQGARLRAWMTHHVLPEFLDRTLSVDAAVALRCASVHVPDPRPERDGLIAATTLVHGMTVVTRNARDFEASGVALVNPWETR